MNKWTFILSAIGASAWIPILITPIINRFRKIQANVFEFRVLSNGVAIPADQRSEKRGTIVLLVLNMFVRGADYYPTNVSAKIQLKNGKEYNAVLIDCSTTRAINNDGTVSLFHLPTEIEFNVARTIKKKNDNIKCLALLIEGIDILLIEDLHAIKLCLISGRFNRKKVIIKESQFPMYNSSRVLANYEEIRKC